MIKIGIRKIIYVNKQLSKYINEKNILNVIVVNETLLLADIFINLFYLHYFGFKAFYCITFKTNSR